MKSWLALFFALWASLANGIEHERRLLPVAVLGAQGAYGSEWSTRVIALNERDGFILGGFRYIGVPPIVDRDVPYEVTPFFSEPGEPPGSIVYVPKEAAEQFHVAAILHERTRDSDTMIPVVPETAFANRPLYFLTIRNEVDARLMLRVYSLEIERSRATVQLRIMAREPSPSGAWRTIFNGSAILTVQQKTDVLGPNTFLLRPLAASIPLGQIVQSAAADAPLVVTVTPESDVRIWAMISRTSNITNEVQLFLPQ